MWLTPSTPIAVAASHAGGFECLPARTRDFLATAGRSITEIEGGSKAAAPRTVSDELWALVEPRPRRARTRLRVSPDYGSSALTAPSRANDLPAACIASSLESRGAMRGPVPSGPLIFGAPREHPNPQNRLRGWGSACYARARAVEVKCVRAMAVSACRLAGGLGCSLGSARVVLAPCQLPQGLFEDFLWLCAEHE